jgi:hypothetical protein
MPLMGTRFLNSVRLKTIVKTLANELEMSRPLIYLDRVPVVQAFDDEIMGRFTGHVFAADLIADDQEAVVQESGQITLETTAIPNIKHGVRLGQAKLNMINRLESVGGRAEEEDALLNWEQSLAEMLVLGVRQRMNGLCCAMMLDNFAYNRLGIVLTGASWGMPSDLKVTPSTAWSTANAATMTPIADIFAMDVVGRDTYGVEFDEIIMASSAFRLVIASTEFKNVAAGYANANFLVSSTNQNSANQPMQQQILGQIFGKTITLDDATYNERTNEGMRVAKRYLPPNKVILNRRENNGNGNIWDFANGVVTESIVGNLIDHGGGVFTGADYGPLAYWTGRGDLNPADTVAWAVARGFPRKFLPEANAVLTVN